jgi:hypothetical protein
MLLLTILLKVVQINTTLLLMLLNLLASKLEPKLITSQMLMRLILQTAVTVHFTIIAQIAIEQITPAPRLLALSVTLIPKSQITTAVAANTAKVSADGSINTHSDVDTSTTAPTSGQALVWNGSNWIPDDVIVPISDVTGLQSALDSKVDKNSAITGATKTKITYDSKGLVIAGADATTDDIAEGSTNKYYPAADAAKLAGIEAGAEVNNISDANATDLTDGGDSALHYHSSDRNRANHTGTQTASTISDFDTEVANNSAVAANTAKVSADGSINTHSDVDTSTTAPTSGQSLVWDGSNWVPTSVTVTISDVTGLQTELDGKVDKNTAITGATKTKITYDSKGLVIAGADATTDDIAEGSTNKYYPAADAAKLAGIEAGAEVNNISDANATDLTDGGNSALHYHSADRNRANHTGTQTASTISNFDTEVANNTAVTANTAKVSADGSINTHSDVDTSTTAPTSGQSLVWDGSNWVPTSVTVTISDVTGLQTELDGKVDKNTAITGATKTKITYDSKGLVIAGADANTDDIFEGLVNKYYPAADATKLAGIEAGAEVNNISDTNATDLTDGGDSTLHYHSSDRNRANHTGTQTASTISNFDTEVANNTAVTANTAKVSADGSINTHSDVDTSTTAPTSGQALVWNGTKWTPGNGGAQPAGSEGEIQFHSSNALGASANLKWTGTKLTVNAEIDALAFNATSDYRLKKDIKEISDEKALLFIDKARPVHYQWKNNNSSSFGFISQEVDKLGFTEMVTRSEEKGLKENIDSDGYVSPKDTKILLNYNQIIPILTKVLQLVRSQIKDLITRIVGVEDDVNELKENFDKQQKAIAELKDETMKLSARTTPSFLESLNQEGRIGDSENFISFGGKGFNPDLSSSAGFGPLKENARLEIRAKGDKTKSIYIKGSGGTTTGTGDLAELYYSRQKLELGDVVKFDPETPAGVIKTNGSYEQRLVGVVSAKPFALLMALNEEKLDNPEYHPVSLTGKMLVKISLENGPIKAGDPLASASTPGYAMKATKGSRIIGHAFESYDGSSHVTDGVEEMFEDISFDCEGCYEDIKPYGKRQFSKAGTFGKGFVLALVQPTYYVPAEQPPEMCTPETEVAPMKKLTKFMDSYCKRFPDDDFCKE